MKSLLLILSKRRYLAPAMLFATLNVFFGTWAIYIPFIKNKLGIDEAELGFAVLFFGIGTFLMLIGAPIIIKRFQVGRASAYGIFLLGFAFLFPFITTSYIGLCASLFFVGMIGGFTDIAINTMVTEIEKIDRVHIMSSNHGFFSLGGMVSAGIGTLFLPKIEEPVYHMLFLVVLMAIINGLLVSNYFKITISEEEESSFSFKYFKPLLALLIIGFLIMGGEGAIVDWSALFLENVSMVKVSMIGLGYTIFSFTMALGRFLGDGISLKFGSRNIIIFGCILACFGFGCILLVKPYIALFGFGLVGLGFSVIVPELFRVGGKMDNIDSAQGISLISGSGFLGFLLGPVFLGFLAKAYTLKLSFTVLFIFTFISFVTAFTLKKKK